MLFRIAGKCITPTLIILFLCHRTHGQEFSDSLNVVQPADTVLFLRDSLKLINHSDSSQIQQQETLYKPDELSLHDELINEEDLSVSLGKSREFKPVPAKAAIMSAVVPGLGQIYNRKVWKVPIVYAAFGTTVYFLIKWQNDFQMYRQAYIDFKDDDPTTNYYLEVVPERFLNNADRYLTVMKNNGRRYRDWFIIAVIVAYGLNILDANVDAHLFDYNIDDNLSLNIRPCFLESGINSRKIGLNLCFTF